MNSNNVKSIWQMNKPQVSIILPTYNRALTLPRAIDSVLNQTCKNLELIIVDDGSTDNTKKIVKEYQQKDKRVIFLENKKNLGAAKSRNKGIKISSGKYVAFQDSDDEWMPTKLSVELDIFSRHKDVGLVFSNAKKTKRIPIKNKTEETMLSGESLTNKLLLNNFIDIHVLIKKDCLIQSGFFDEYLPRFQDWELWIRLSKYVCFANTNQSLYYTNYSDDGISAGSWEKYIAATKHILKKHSSLFKLYPKAHAKRLLLLGDSYLRNNQIDLGLKTIRKSLRTKIYFKNTIVMIGIVLFGAKFYLQFSKKFISYIK